MNDGFNCARVGGRKSESEPEPEPEERSSGLGWAFGFVVAVAGGAPGVLTGVDLRVDGRELRPSDGVAGPEAAEGV